MNRFPKMYYLLLAAFLVFAGCSSDDSDPVNPPAVNEALELNKAIEGADGGYLNVAAPALITATVVHEGPSVNKHYYLIDIRSAADYAAGHAPGAVNVKSTEIVNHVSGINHASYDNVVVICYTGQTAAWATALLRLSGVNNAASMKYGMSAWNKSLDKITSSCKNEYAGQFVTGASPAKNAMGELPVVATGKTTGADILKERIAVVQGQDFGPAAITADVVLQDPSQYYIINYWADADYTGIGHINGSIQYTPKADLKLATLLKTLPVDKTIVVYCYTGQTSANVATILRVMGYNAKSLKFGTMGMIYDVMAGTTKKPFNVTSDSNEFVLVQ